MLYRQGTAPKHRKARKKQLSNQQQLGRGKIDVSSARRVGCGLPRPAAALPALRSQHRAQHAVDDVHDALCGRMGGC